MPYEFFVVMQKQDGGNAYASSLTQNERMYLLEADAIAALTALGPPIRKFPCRPLGCYYPARLAGTLDQRQPILARNKRA